MGDLLQESEVYPNDFWSGSKIIVNAHRHQVLTYHRIIRTLTSLQSPVGSFAYFEGPVSLYKIQDTVARDVTKNMHSHT